jgi:hypothetical protein
MDILRYLASVVLLVGIFAFGAKWLVGSPPSQVASIAQAANAEPAPADIAPTSQLASLSPVYPTFVGKGLANVQPFSAELMRKKLQRERLAERPKKKKRKPVARPKIQVPETGTEAYAFSPYRQPASTSWFQRDDR